MEPRDLPLHTVRISQRARRMQIRIFPSGQMEVVVPEGVDHRRIPAFLSRHRSWIEQALLRLQGNRAPAAHPAIPDHIVLRAVGEEWRVRLNTDARRTSWMQDGSLLHVAASDEAGARRALHRWLHGKAKAHLPGWLQEVSDELGLPFADVAVRAQKTRWGSCSPRKDISVNRNLLFLPAPLVRYLFVHELCHTVHLSHCRRFWALVESLEPDYRKLDAELRKGARHVPLWAHPPR